MTYYDNHIEPELIRMFNATPSLALATEDEAHVLRAQYRDHEGRLNWHYIHAENQERLQIKYWYCAERRAMIGVVHFGCGTQGPPQHAHGGSMATTLDDTGAVANAAPCLADCS